MRTKLRTILTLESLYHCTQSWKYVLDEEKKNTATSKKAHLILNGFRVHWYNDKQVMYRAGYKNTLNMQYILESHVYIHSKSYGTDRKTLSVIQSTLVSHLAQSQSFVKSNRRRQHPTTNETNGQAIALMTNCIVQSPMVNHGVPTFIQQKGLKHYTYNTQRTFQ